MSGPSRTNNTRASRAKPYHRDATHACPLPECGGVTFTRKSDLQRHINAHVEGRKYKCEGWDDNCTFSTSQKSNLDTHIRAVHQKIPVTCEWCGKGLSDPSTLCRHKKTCSERPFDAPMRTRKPKSKPEFKGITKPKATKAKQPRVIKQEISEISSDMVNVVDTHAKTEELATYMHRELNACIASTSALPQPTLPAIPAPAPQSPFCLESPVGESWGTRGPALRLPTPPAKEEYNPCYPTTHPPPTFPSLTLPELDAYPPFDANSNLNELDLSQFTTPYIPYPDNSYNASSTSTNVPAEAPAASTEWENFDLSSLTDEQLQAIFDGYEFTDAL